MENAVTYIKQKSNIKPKIGIVLGSGLDMFCEKLDSKINISYNDIPNFRKTSIKGHKGEFVLGKLYNQSIICANGRFHFYEGYEYDDVAIIIDMFKKVGCTHIIMTNSSGCVDKSWDIGDLMLITGHIDYSFRKSSDTLKIIQDSRYDTKLLNQVEQIATQKKITLRKGNYVWTTGPTYETPAEIQDIEKLGGHAVGMSGLPEIERIHDLDMKMIGLCCLTNYASGISKSQLTHNEVVDTAKTYQQNFLNLLDAIIKNMLLN
jgi:purine-nucleoside phosphorylase